MKLYTYFRSSAAYRVRIALNLKGIDYDSEFIHLVKEGGMQHQELYRKVNPAGLVPSLETDEGCLSNTLAIIEYLDERFREPRLLPESIMGRAWVRSLSQSIACDIHPLNNLRTLQYLKNNLGIDDAGRDSWYAHWITVGFEGLEQQLARSAHTGDFCFGNTPGLVDCCLIPQVYNAQRFAVDLEPYQQINRIYANCMELQAFIGASPEHQLDAEC